MATATGKRFALIGVAGYIARRHLDAIRDVGGDLACAFDVSDSVGQMDASFPARPLLHRLRAVRQPCAEPAPRGQGARLRRDLLAELPAPLAYRVRAALRRRRDLRKAAGARAARGRRTRGTRGGDRPHSLDHPAAAAQPGQHRAARRTARPSVARSTLSTSPTSPPAANGTTPPGKATSGVRAASPPTSASTSTICSASCSASRSASSCITGRWIAPPASWNTSGPRCAGSCRSTAATCQIPPKTGPPAAASSMGDRVCNLSGDFSELHTRSYQEILAGRGFPIDEARQAIETVAAIRQRPSSPTRARCIPTWSGCSPTAQGTAMAIQSDLRSGSNGPFPGVFIHESAYVDPPLPDRRRHQDLAFRPHPQGLRYRRALLVRPERHGRARRHGWRQLQDPEQRLALQRRRPRGRRVLRAIVRLHQRQQSARRDRAQIRVRTDAGQARRHASAPTPPSSAAIRSANTASLPPAPLSPPMCRPMR